MLEVHISNSHSANTIVPCPDVCFFLHVDAIKTGEGTW